MDVCIEALSAAAQQHGLTLGPAFASDHNTSPSSKSNKSSSSPSPSSEVVGGRLQVVPAVAFPCVYNYDGMYFMIFKIT